MADPGYDGPEPTIHVAFRRLFRK